MTPQPLKIRADVELNCFQLDGVLHIKVLRRYINWLLLHYMSLQLELSVRLLHFHA